jgi:hypothetical protein
MRIFLCSLLFLLISISCGRSNPATITATEDVASRTQTTGSLQLSIAQASPAGKIMVRATNISQKPLRIWKDTNSWGAARWRVLVIRREQLQTFFQNPDHDFTRNFPSYTELAPGAFFEQTLDLNDGDWRGDTNGKVQFVADDRVVAIYDVPFTTEALNSKVWYGTVAALTTIGAK